MKDWNEEEIIPISAISHHLYCPRQNALIHVEGIFRDNELTVSGNIGHEFVDEEKSMEDHGVHKETSLRIYSDIYGISGIADIVEFPDAMPPYPIDYKNGKIDSWENHEAQLCAIALCLEEMLEVPVPQGAIYHIQSKKRHSVIFTESLKEITLQAIQEIREILLKQSIIEPNYSSKCKNCSLQEACMPQVSIIQKKKSIFTPVDLVY